ncbi:amylo-alpha-1,6-glucosidase [Rathayibacter iranicus]|nr:amylo-alpha-1,6-glucosidase [Rathayibacter iranicus]PPI68525.1 amylo-alpha-1,6-glucosidase [Rathayibacter iranicus]
MEYGRRMDRSKKVARNGRQCRGRYVWTGQPLSGERMSHPHRPGEQPLSADLVTVLAAPCVGLSDAAGVIDPTGASGLYDGDLRLLSSWRLVCDGGEVAPAGTALVEASSAVFQCVVRGVGDPEPHATVGTTLVRTAHRDGFVDRVLVSNGGRTRVRPTIAVHLGSDLASLALVRSGQRIPELLSVPRGDRELTWSKKGAGAVVEASPAPAVLVPGRMAWTLDLPPGASEELTLRVRSSAQPAAPRDEPARFPLAISYSDSLWQRHIERSISDLDALRMSVDGDEVLAAGAPWYLALFGRDSIWAARLCLPFDPDLALSTLRVLARHQGRIEDARTGESPGKILHERREVDGDGRASISFASSDATPLWILLLVEALDAGVPRAALSDLLPALTRATEWLAHRIERDRFLFYDEIPGIGAVHQAWKDSTDSVFDSDGRDLAFPVALVELQGYAHAALAAAARLYRVFALDGAGRLDHLAADLRADFDADFWVQHARWGRIPALALNADGRCADVLASNIGHLLGTGVLDSDGERRVVDLLMSTDLATPLGLRTLAASEVRYSPFSYHNGSVWPHDVGIIVRGLLGSGFRAEAVELASRIVETSRHFDGRLPEVWGGDTLGRSDRPVNYPTACRPQAWSAATALACLAAVASPYVDPVEGTWQVRPIAAFAGGGVVIART